MSNTITVSTSYTLSDEAIKDILDGALEYSIGYWASAGNYTASTKTWWVKDDEEGVKYSKTYADILKACVDIAIGNIAINSDIRSAIAEMFVNYDDAVGMDADAYDCIIQVACFGELVYG